MNKRLLLIGKNGQLGSALLRALSGEIDLEVFAFSREDFDFTDFNVLKDTLNKIKPDLIFNAAAFTNVDAAESNHNLVDLVNVELIKVLADFSANKGAILINFSTDYIFDGSAKSPYKEDAEPNPINYYGLSKLKGEQALVDGCERFYNVRTSFMYGHLENNFLSFMLNLAKSRDKLSIVDDQIASPTYVYDLISVLLYAFIFPNLNISLCGHFKSFKSLADNAVRPYDFGTYHVANNGFVSRFDFINTAFSILGLKKDLERVSSDFFPSPAKRPLFSALDNTKLPKIRDWEDALKAFLI